MDVIRKLRDRQASQTEGYMLFMAACGLPVAGSRQRKPIGKGEQLSKDIRTQCRHGVPTKGASHGRKLPHVEGLAGVVALNEPVLVRKGPLKHRCLIKSKVSPKGWAARAIRLGGKPLTRKQKRSRK